MPFNNPIVGGQNLVRNAIQSPGFVPGSVGWRIAKDGSAEFSGAVIRGDFQAGDAPDDFVLIDEFGIHVHHSGDLVGEWLYQAGGSAGPPGVLNVLNLQASSLEMGAADPVDPTPTAFLSIADGSESSTVGAIVGSDTRLRFYDNLTNFDPIIVENGTAPIDDNKSWRQILNPNVADFTSAAFADWITGFANIPVPLWARDGTATAEIVSTTQAQIITATGEFQLRIVADSTNGTASRVRAQSVTDQFPMVAAMAYTIPAAATSIAVKVQALRVSAGGALRASSAVNTVSVMDVVIHV